jgi:hypothetical protein
MGGDGGEVVDGECGDPNADGVIVYDDVESDTTWECPVYTLTRPIFVRSSTAERTRLRILPGVTVRGVKGDLEAAKFPGALIVTRTGRLEAIGTAELPVVFTSAQPIAERAPGDWGGVALLGRAPTNVPANYEGSGNVAGEMYIEGLTKSELVLYGAPFSEPSGEGGEGGGGNGGVGGEGGDGSGPAPSSGDPAYDCGVLEYVRIEYAGFEVASTKELNGLTLGGCGHDTIVDHVQVHESSDDGIEFFGGTVDVSHVVVTGTKDDGLDWDQGWSGRAQFVAIQMHDDTAFPADEKGDNGIEADGWADPTQPIAAPSGPRIFNMTLIASKTSHRALRLREGTRGYIGNSIIVAHADGATDGLVDLSDAYTADWFAEGELGIEHTLFFGSWPSGGQADSHGVVHAESTVFPAATGNVVLESIDSVLPSAFDEAAPGWVPAAASPAATEGSVPSDPSNGDDFFDASATYRGAFEPGGEDWTAGWTAYP